MKLVECILWCVYLFSNAASSQTIRRIVLLGERNSGTTFMERLLTKSVHNKYRISAKIPFFSSNIPILSYKHMWRHDLLSDKELEQIAALHSTLFILQMRNACSWVDGMYRKPWHMCPSNSKDPCSGIYVAINRNETSKMTRAQFMLNAWRDNAEATRNVANYTYANVFDLRRHKLKIMLQLKQIIPHRTYISRLHVLERNPNAVLRELRAIFGIQLKPNVFSLTKSLNVHPPVCLTQDEYEIVQRAVDWVVEGQVGYSIDDCKMCTSAQTA